MLMQKPGTNSKSTPSTGCFVVVLVVLVVVLGRLVVALNKYGCSSLRSVLDPASAVRFSTWGYHDPIKTFATLCSENAATGDLDIELSALEAFVRTYSLHQVVPSWQESPEFT